MAVYRIYVEKKQEYRVEEKSVMEDIVNGRMTFQRAFMSGAMKAKGDFAALRMLDELFVFEET